MTADNSTRLDLICPSTSISCVISQNEHNIRRELSMKEEVLEQKAGGNGDLTKGPKGLEFGRYFTREGISPYDTVEWEYRTAAITSESGEVIFEQKNVEVPKSWSMTATNIVASKYFHGKRGTPERESSVRQLIGRVASTITEWGSEGGYFAREQDAAIFHDELVHLLLNQMMAFNSPVWFNCGIELNPQCSACFINSVEDIQGAGTDAHECGVGLYLWGAEHAVRHDHQPVAHVEEYGSHQ